MCLYLYLYQYIVVERFFVIFKFFSNIFAAFLRIFLTSDPPFIFAFSAIFQFFSPNVLLILRFFSFLQIFLVTLILFFSEFSQFKNNIGVDVLKGMGEEHAIILMNHHYELDWLYGWMVGDSARLLGNARYDQTTIRGGGGGYGCCPPLSLKL